MMTEAKLLLVPMINVTGSDRNANKKRAFSRYFQRRINIGHQQINVRHRMAVKNRQSRETGNIRYTRHKTKAEKKTITICVGHHHTQEEDKQNKKHNTIYVVYTTMRKQTHIT